MARKPKIVGFISLGCAKNLVDSEVMLALLAEAGCPVTSDLSQAEVIVVNTCGFLAAARDEALDAIAEAVEHKRLGTCRRIVVVGCLVQRDAEDLRNRIPEIDVLVGVHEREDIVRAVLAKKRVDRLSDAPPAEEPAQSDALRLRLTPRPSAYLRISEGCSQRCTYCTIPMIRGPMRSKPIDVVLDEARTLIADGVVELNVIAQDTTAYGHDLPDGPGLADLLRALDDLDGVEWIRLMYAYPRHFDNTLLDAVAQSEHIVPYVDLPLQHISDRVLRRMGRGVTRELTERLLARLRDRIPDIALRTTLMVGFPGETEDDFAELLDFVRRTRFDALGVFAYSNEPETPAARLDDHVPEDVKRQRLDAIMQAQQEIAFEKNRAFVGRTLEVLVEYPIEDGTLITRHAQQAPEVDGIVRVLDAPEDAGPFLRVECTEAEGYDLIARTTVGILPS